VRNPDRLTFAAGSIHVVKGDLLDDPSVLDAVVANQDAVISSLGVGQSFKPGGLISRAAPVIVTAMERLGVRRLIFTSAFGVGATRQDTPLVPRLFIATLLRAVYADKEAGEVAILNSSLDWTIVYPGGLTNGPKTGRYRAGERLLLAGFPRISRADVAAFLLQQVDDRRFVRKGVLVAT
jgi:putative NADH-flavin reductase